MTVEAMRRGVSNLRNRVIARVFRELRLIEQWGSGVSRIFREAQEQGLPEPSIEEIGLHLRFTVYFAHPMTAETAVTTGHPKESGDDTANGVESEARLESCYCSLINPPERHNLHKTGSENGFRQPTPTDQISTGTTIH